MATSEGRPHQLQGNFSAGELSPKLAGRVDLARYHNGCETMQNFIPLVQGGAQRRYGTRYVAGVKTHAKKVRLIPFEFSTVQSYVLEFGDQYMRVYKDSGQVMSGGNPVEVVTPYLEADLPSLMFAQSADTLYITHASYEPRKLTRTSHTAWTLSTVTGTLKPPPTVEADTDLGTTLTLGATTGTGVAITAGVAVFLASDVDRQIKGSAGGRAIIRTVAAGPGAVATGTVDILENFPAVGPIASGSWFVTGTPATTCTPDKTGPVGALVTLTLTAEGWRAADVGKYVKIRGGQVKLTVVTSTTVATGEVLTILSATTGAAAGSWTLETVAWSSALGWPRAVTFAEQRLGFFSTTTYPQSGWLSQVGKFDNFAVGTAAADAIAFTIASNQVNAILWAMPTRNLLLGTLGAEYRMAGSGTDEAMSPTSLTVKADTTYGTAAVLPVRVGPSVMFLQRGAKVLRELQYDFNADAYDAPDLTLLAEHITGTGITQMAFTKEVAPTLWAVRADGQLLGMTYDKKAEIVGWARHTTDGEFESVAVIYDAVNSREQTWVAVKRTINGATKRYVEYMDPTLNTDCALTYSGAPATVFSGLGHLAAKTVQVRGDSAAYPDEVVSAGGAITIDPAASAVEVGLAYESKVVSMRPEIKLGSGSSAGLKKRWSRLFVRFLSTLGGTVNGKTLATRSSEDLMGSAPAAVTGDVEVPVALGWDAAQVTIRQTQPLPMTILAYGGTLLVSDP